MGVCVSVCDGIDDFAGKKEYYFCIDGNRVDFERGEFKFSRVFEKRSFYAGSLLEHFCFSGRGLRDGDCAGDHFAGVSKLPRHRSGSVQIRILKIFELFLEFEGFHFA